MIGNVSQNKCYIIAEAGVNHIISEEEMKKFGCANSLEVAYKLVDTAVECGADAIKFQSFKADKLQFKGTQKPKYQEATTTEDYYELIKRLETSEEDQIKIATYCKEKGITFLSTPYDNESVDFLESIDVPAYKVASIDLTNHILIKKIVQKNKPVILSSGLSSMEDVEDTMNFIDDLGYLQNIILLQCTSNYPTAPNDIHLNVLRTYTSKFPDTIVGLSDHSPTFIASIGARALGGLVFEKHFTLDKTLSGPDHVASLDPKELREWILAFKEIEVAMGSSTKIVTDVEKSNHSMKKFLVISDITQGEVITEHHLKALRTGQGILPTVKNLNKIIGKKVTRSITKDTVFEWGFV